MSSILGKSSSEESENDDMLSVTLKEKRKKILHVITNLLTESWKTKSPDFIKTWAERCEQVLWTDAVGNMTLYENESTIADRILKFIKDYKIDQEKLQLVLEEKEKRLKELEEEKEKRLTQLKEEKEKRLTQFKERISEKQLNEIYRKNNELNEKMTNFISSRKNGEPPTPESKKMANEMITLKKNLMLRYMHHAHNCEKQNCCCEQYKLLWKHIRQNKHDTAEKVKQCPYDECSPVLRLFHHLKFCFDNNCGICDGIPKKT
jgi:hypothetical protein